MHRKSIHFAPKLLRVRLISVYTLPSELFTARFRPIKRSAAYPFDQGLSKIGKKLHGPAVLYIPRRCLTDILNRTVYVFRNAPAKITAVRISARLSSWT